MAAALSAKEAARELGTDPRTFRKFMRSILPKEEQPGQGNRYAIEARKLPKLRKQFDECHAPKVKSDNGEEAEDVIDEELIDDDIFDDDDTPDFSASADDEDEPDEDDLDEMEAEEEFDLEEL